MVKIIYELIYGMQLKSIVLAIVFISILWLFLSIWFARKEQTVWMWKKCNSMGVLIELLAIIATTMVRRDINICELFLQPLNFFKEAKIQPEIYRSMFMNIFLFFPLGLTLPFTLPEKWNRKALIAILFALTLSISIEFLQYYYHLGRAETDDVLCNTLGCDIGTLSYTLERKLFNK